MPPSEWATMTIVSTGAAAGGERAQLAGEGVAVGADAMALSA